MIFLLVILLLTVVGVFAGTKTWTHRFAVALDVFTGSITEMKFGVTISSWCGIQLRLGAKGNRFGKVLGTLLNKIQKGHCDLAIAADLQRSMSAQTFLVQGLSTAAAIAAEASAVTGKTIVAKEA